MNLVLIFFIFVSWPDPFRWLWLERRTMTLIEELFEIHNGLGAATGRDVFGKDMLADHRMAVELGVERIYGQILDR